MCFTCQHGNRQQRKLGSGTNSSSTISEGSQFCILNQTTLLRLQIIIFWKRDLCAGHKSSQIFLFFICIFKDSPIFTSIHPPIHINQPQHYTTITMFHSVDGVVGVICIFIFLPHGEHFAILPHIAD